MRDMLALDIGIALHERLQLIGGPRRGCQVDPPEGVVVEQPSPDELRARGTVLIRDPQGERALARETFRLRAIRRRARWRATLLLDSSVEEPRESAAV